MSRSSSRVSVVTALFVFLSVSVAFAGSDNAVIIVKNKAKSNGEITFTFTPGEGDAQEIKVGVIEKMAPSDIAADIMKEFALALGDEYKVKMKDNDKVSIQAKPKDKNTEMTFEIVISGQSVAGLSVIVK